MRDLDPDSDSDSQCHCISEPFNPLSAATGDRSAVSQLIGSNTRNIGHEPAISLSGRPTAPESPDPESASSGSVLAETSLSRARIG
ncbi:hypothetical protein SISSUDRAFT_426126 [Sistotremastrum suecicum HHB10207 ss-3]|uniref:Uncharacterized protein n=1 Tax=Sistotremastrum suecicum HHB10207 ss-3 TaxID=1314776 RepID=A0A166FKR4_9AGAM|nr:hypothetical protein SISSUDRAFT_426126 [Sistotremastrum suecicum HHB10207 ss-3]